MAQDINTLLARERKLDSLARGLIVAIVAVSALLALMVFAGAIVPPALLVVLAVLQTAIATAVAAGVTYVTMQRQAVRRELQTAHAELEGARRDALATCDRLSFAYETAEAVAPLDRPDGIRTALGASLRHFAADAAAIVSNGIELVTAEGADSSEARSAIVAAVRDAAAGGGAILSPVITTPLKVPDDPEALLALWKRTSVFDARDTEGLRLMAHVLEPALANRALLGETRTQLSGTLQAMVELLERRCPRCIPSCEKVAEYAVTVGRAVGMTDDEIEDLRLAAMLHDVGMLDVPESIVAAPRALTSEEWAVMATHAKKGADLARLANFGQRVEQTILCHHERIDGTGYPRGLTGPSIPLEARILAVCDAYVAMTSDRPHRPRMSQVDAVNQLRAGAGEHFDAGIVREFVAMRSGHLADQASERHPA